MKKILVDAVLYLIIFITCTMMLIVMNSCSSSEAQPNQERLENISPSQYKKEKDSLLLKKEKDSLLIENIETRDKSWEDILLNQNLAIATAGGDEEKELQEQYIREKFPLINKLNKTGLMDGTLMTLFYLEAKYGQSKLAKEAGNHAGVKGDYNGNSYYTYDDCTEKVKSLFGSKNKKVPCAFREYTKNGEPSFWLFMSDYNDWWQSRTEWEQYAPVFKANTVKSQLIALAKSPYASESPKSREKKLLSIATRHNLYKYDNKGEPIKIERNETKLPVLKTKNLNVSPREVEARKKAATRKKGLVFGIDIGHGQNTAGKRVFFSRKVLGKKEWTEHELNKSIATAIYSYAKKRGVNVKYSYLPDELKEDASLTSRTRKLNEISKTKMGFHTSVHHNAIKAKASGGHNCSGETASAETVSRGASGHEVFYKENSVWGKRWATLLNEKFHENLKKGMNNRGIKIPPKRFTLIYGSNEPTVIMEYGFYDDEELLKIIMENSPIKYKGHKFKNKFHMAAALGYFQAAVQIKKEYEN